MTVMPVHPLFNIMSNKKPRKKTKLTESGNTRDENSSLSGVSPHMFLSLWVNIKIAAGKTYNVANMHDEKNEDKESVFLLQ